MGNDFPTIAIQMVMTKNMIDIAVFLFYNSATITHTSNPTVFLIRESSNIIRTIIKAIYIKSKMILRAKQYSKHACHVVIPLGIQPIGDSDAWAAYIMFYKFVTVDSLTPNEAYMRHCMD